MSSRNSRRVKTLKISDSDCEESYVALDSCSENVVSLQGNEVRELASDLAEESVMRLLSYNSSFRVESESSFLRDYEKVIKTESVRIGVAA